MLRFYLLILEYRNIINSLSVGKRFAILLAFLLVAGLAILGYFLHQGRKGLLADPYRVISPEACIVIETVDLQSFINSLTTGKGLFGEIEKFKELEGFSLELKYLSDRLNNEGFRKLLSYSKAIISFVPGNDGKLKPLLSMSVPGEIRFRQVKDIIRTSGIKEMNDNNSMGYPVLEIPYKNSNQSDTAYISLISGILVCTNSQTLLKEAFTRVDGGKDVRDLPGFSRVLSASGKHEDKIFVVFKNLRKVLKSILNDDSSLLAEKILRLAGTGEGDIYINDEGLALSGYTESIDSSDLLYKFKSIPPREFHTYKILPSSTALFETIIMAGQGIGKAGAGNFSDEVFELAGKLRKYTGEEVTRALIDIKDRPVDENTLIIYELKNRVEAEQIFLNVPGDEKEIIYFEPDDQVKIPVYKRSFSGLTALLTPGFAPGFNETYFVFFDNYLITGTSFITISRLLYDNLLNKTLANDLVYRDFESTLPSFAAYFFYCVPSRITDYLSGFLKESIIASLKTNRNSINKIQAVGYQLASSNNMVYNSMSVRFKDEVREESKTEWETLLDTTAAIKPFFFTNHNTGAKEIFIQDLNNNTYLINAAGRVLWKVPLRERIIGTIYMIDYYRNGKYQLLFSGHGYLHLLDRNGNYVERYPVKLRSPATNSLALFDYDNNLNYRLFIAGEDRLIYSYDKSGNVVKGWKPYKTPGYVRSEINYFKVSGKDYIVASDENSVYILDRTGNKRITIKEPVSKARGSAMRLNPGSDPSVVCTASDGTIQHIYFDGSVKKFNLVKVSSDHSFDIFDIDGDGFGEYVFIDKGILYLYDNNRSEMFTRDFDSTDLGGPINFIFSASDRKIGVIDGYKNLIYLIDEKGNTINGFPLRGASMFSIGKLSDRSGWHLIVGGTDRFLYNYKFDTESK